MLSRYGQITTVKCVLYIYLETHLWIPEKDKCFNNICNVNGNINTRDNCKDISIML